ncbi:MAG: right-handed parallel beta-helix repeat-containing protein [Saprospiraceae bacterium]|nr:right-handed parallel beta-helix repeat-containing protein [Saprospiraceae bacterium]
MPPSYSPYLILKWPQVYRKLLTLVFFLTAFQIVIFNPLSAQIQACGTPGSDGLGILGGCDADRMRALPASGCNNYEQYSPLVPEHTPVKIIRLVVHVVQRDAGDLQGPRNFENNGPGLYWINAMIERMKLHYQQIPATTPQSVACPTPNIVDSRIRFYVENILFHQNTTHWDVTTGEASSCQIFYDLVQNNPLIPAEQKDNAMHVFLIHSDWLNGDSGFSSGIGILNEKFVVIDSYFVNTLENPIPNIDDAPVLAAINLGHELAHAFGLDHAFATDYCCDTDNPASKNLMKYFPFHGSALTQCQLARMHFVLESGNNCSLQNQCSDTWKTVITDYCNKDESYDIRIPAGNQVTWEVNKKLTTDVIVESGAQLTIRCRIGLPDKANIIVERGARLIVDGGTITHNKSMWPRCKADGQWGSILVAGNTAIPHELAMRNEAYIQNANGPGIVILRNAIIEYGRLAVYTSSEGIPWPTSDQYWGGFVYAENTDFRNNHRSAAFMKFDHTNFSAFVDCEFIDEDGSANFGVTNWACNGLLFDKCTFSGLNSTGIIAYDSGITVLLSVFEKNNYGIEAYATFPLGTHLQIGTDDPASANSFIENYVAIYGNAANRLFVKRNQFTGNTFGVALHGESQYEVSSNTFSQSTAAIHLVQTGQKFNRVNCNTHQDVFGMYITGGNRGLEFVRQDFSTYYDVVLINEGADPGRLTNQGASGRAVWNYFSDHSANVGNIATIGVTTPFEYFHPDPSNGARLKPDCALNDPPGGSCPTSYNYLNFQTTGSRQGCLDDTPPPVNEPSCISKPCLNSVNQQITLLEAIAHPNEAQKRELEQLNHKRSAIFWALLDQELDAGDYTEAESLLTEDGSKIAQRNLIGLKAKRGHYLAA